MQPASETTQGMSYAGTGVRYGQMDPYKRAAQLAGMETAGSLGRFGFETVPWSSGESVVLVKTPLGHIGFVVEGLGTKNKVTDAMDSLAHEVLKQSGLSYYYNVAQCNVAMAVNDLITLGVMPVVYGQYLALGDSGWLANEARSKSLAEGTKQACKLARCYWGCGETPTLKGIIDKDTVDLAGATWGIVPSATRLINPANIRHGDAIIIVGSSGIHANGLTLGREISSKLPGGFLHELPDGRGYGETLLDPTLIYVDVVEDCQLAGVRIHYAVNVTGHGWRKLMRAPQDFTYVIDTLPAPLPIFDFIQERGPVSDEEAYGNFNMGAGFALYVPQEDVEKALRAIAKTGKTGFVAGYIEAGEKKVVIRPKNIVFRGDSLEVR